LLDRELPLELPPERDPLLLEGALNEFERLREELLIELFELLEGALHERDELLRSRVELSGCIHLFALRDCLGETYVGDASSVRSGAAAGISFGRWASTLGRTKMPLSS
jgi:hypothetical protein